MRLYVNWLQKLVALAAVAIAFITFSFAPASAENPGDTSSCTDQTTCLRFITQNTYNILQKVNALPDFFLTISAYFDNLISGDASQTTSQIAPNFTNVGNSIINANNTANSSAQTSKMMADILRLPVTDFQSLNGQAPNVLSIVPYVNDISYPTMLGMPLVTNGTSTDPQGFLRNAAGINFPHIAPKGSWAGVNELPKYLAYYNSIIAAESFGAHVLNRLLNENTSGNQLNAYQALLVSQASNDSWLKTVGSEEIGKVLRQILLFQSQMYVLMTQLVQNQKEMLTAMVLANTLQIQVNQDKEYLLLTRAQNVTPQ